MLTVPAFVWRGGFFSRAAIVGGSVGLSLGTLAWIDSGLLLTGVIVLVVVGLTYGVWMARRMARLWPTAAQLSGMDRVRVARATRRGERLPEKRLVHAANDYRVAMHAAADAAHGFRWLVAFLLAVAAGTAVWDAWYGSAGNAVVSAIYLVMLLIEVFWWPRRRRQLLENVDRACG
ncbi:hypothetical protein A5630_02515 [Mycolicibacterium mucogenicum]|uniref:Uncharacterized protein n=1 Tax=Mycolicibacterium mucogenicum TaxID=56689 RepID=A0A1A3GSN5_MYCMU|nr:hypothetical protein [Mycolicibacterium mucogenicum]OBJ38860.1 hypothetical protein A5630_02515 [Mycolicibacterium mucogenicum]